MNYIRFGKGQDIIFLHGWGGSTQSFLQTAQNINGCCTLIDMYGFGNTPHPNYPLTIKDYTKGIIALMDKLNIQSAIFVCHSFGGRVGIELAVYYPDRVKKLVLVDSAGIKPKRTFKYYFLLLKHKILKKLRGYGLKGSSDYCTLSPTMQKTFINVVNYNQTKILKNISAKTLIIWGQNDLDTPLYMANILNKKIKNSKLIIFTNCGHFSYLDNNGKFVAILSAFINEK